jgi:hypothetical protein
MALLVLKFGFDLVFVEPDGRSELTDCLAPSRA